MSVRRFFLLLSLGTLATVVLLWATQVPLGVPGEWTWKRIEFHAADSSEAGLFAIVIALSVAIYLLIAKQGVTRIESAGRLQTAGWLTGLTSSAFALLWILAAEPPGGYSAVKTVWVLYDRGASGYFHEASKVDNLPEFLANYENMTAGDYVPFGESRKQRDVYHIGTHPPGLIVFHRWLIDLCRNSPRLTEALLATQPAAHTDAFEALSRRGGGGPELPAGDRAALWLAVIVTHIFAAATVVPLFLLIRLTDGARAGWMTATFWPLIPALAIFLPKSDALLPFVATTFLWLWLGALRDSSIWRAAAAGIVMWIGLFTSLALLPVALLAVLLTIWETLVVAGAETGWRKLGRPLFLAAVSLATFAAAILALLWQYDACLPTIWWENYRNHAGFYEKDSHPRSYGLWLIANAVELTIAVGWPVMLLAGRKFVQTVSAPQLRRTREAGPIWCCAAVIGLLWISGKNMGEAGRLWLFLMPWILWIGAGVWREPDGEAGSRRRDWFWLTVLIAQAVACWLTAIRVRAFFVFELG